MDDAATGVPVMDLKTKDSTPPSDRTTSVEDAKGHGRVVKKSATSKLGPDVVVRSPRFSGSIR
jgi:hypothetical protein